MSFDSAERSVQDSNLADLYDLTLGATVYRYTSHDTDIVFGGFTYTAISIRRGTTGVTGQDSQYELIITMAGSAAFVLDQLAGLPPMSTSCVVRRLQIDEGAAIKIWEGECGPVAIIDDDEAEFRVACTLDDPIATMVPSARCQRLCNHTLYDEMCGLLETDHDLAATVEDASGITVTVSATGVLAGKLTSGGKIRVGAEERTIVKEVGNVLTLLAPFPLATFNQLPIPVACTLIKGCKHTVTYCRDEFDNVDNFGGFPYLDWKNPFEGFLAWT